MRAIVRVARLEGRRGLSQGDAGPGAPCRWCRIQARSSAACSEVGCPGSAALYKAYVYNRPRLLDAVRGGARRIHRRFAAECPARRARSHRSGGAHGANHGEFSSERPEFTSRDRPSLSCVKWAESQDPPFLDPLACHGSTAKHSSGLSTGERGSRGPAATRVARPVRPGRPIGGAFRRVSCRSVA